MEKFDEISGYVEKEKMKVTMSTFENIEWNVIAINRW